MGPPAVVRWVIIADDHAGLVEGVQLFPVPAFILEVSMKPFCHGLPGSIYRVFTPCSFSHGGTTATMNSMTQWAA